MYMIYYAMVAKMKHFYACLNKMCSSGEMAWKC